MPPPVPTVYIETYGCQMNVSDSELMYGRLAEEGYTSVDKPDGADVILVKTSAIRDKFRKPVMPFRNEPSVFCTGSERDPI